MTLAQIVLGERRRRTRNNKPVETGSVREPGLATLVDSVPDIPAERSNPGVFLRSFAVLDYVVRAGRPVLAVDIATHLGLPKPTVYRMIEQFEAEGFLQRQFMSRHLAIGPRLTGFAFDTLRSSVQYALRRQILNALVAKVGETCNVGALDGSEIVYFDRVEATHCALQLHFHVGSKVPLHCTAIGKLFLAFLPEAKSAPLIEQIAFESYTRTTITTNAALRAELDGVRRDGLALDREEYLTGVVCLAAPIFNARQDITAGIAIQAPAARMPVSDVYRHRAVLLEAARALCESLMLTE